jgi:hypothetical protein
MNEDKEKTKGERGGEEDIDNKEGKIGTMKEKNGE